MIWCVISVPLEDAVLIFCENLQIFQKLISYFTISQWKIVSLDKYENLMTYYL